MTPGPGNRIGSERTIRAWRNATAERGTQGVPCLFPPFDLPVTSEPGFYTGEGGGGVRALSRWITP
jgi:hypothetical protein